MTSTKQDCRESFAATIMRLAAHDDRIVAVFNDSISSSNLKAFEAQFPERTFNVGIAEQNMIGVAAGLANAGLIPVVCAASCFLCGRAFEQIKVDIGYSNVNVKLFGMSPGFAYGALGATHHSPEDIALIQSIPNILIGVPCDPDETASAVEAVVRHQGPTFLRILRTPVAPILPADRNLSFGSSVTLKRGSDVLLVASGLMVHEAYAAAKLLEDARVSCGVIAATSIRPFDVESLVHEMKAYRYVVTVEEGYALGGLGGRVAQIVATHDPKILMQLGATDFAPTGSTEEVLRHFDLDAAGIAFRTRALVAASPARNAAAEFSAAI